jgi:alpha-L-fucosidase 2
MKPTRREFLQTSALIAVGDALPAPAGVAAPSEHQALDGFQIARRHMMVRDLPGEDFFQGMLLGNGDIGVCAVVRPDAIGLHIGKSDSWDIRVSEDIAKHILPFQEVVKLWSRASEEAKRLGKPEMLFLESSIDFFRDYTNKVASSYSRPWPRPWPCGTVWLHWDPRWVQPGRQTLDPSSGLYTLDLTCSGFKGAPRRVRLSCFVDWMTGLVSVSTDGSVAIYSVDYYPELDDFHASPVGFTESQATWGVLPRPEIDGKVADAFAEFSCFQYFPAIGPTEGAPKPPKSEKDRNFALHARIAGKWTLEGLAESQDRLGQDRRQGSRYFHANRAARRIPCEPQRAASAP